MYKQFYCLSITLVPGRMNNGLVIEPPSYKVKDTDITGFPPEVAENPVEGNVKL